MDAFAPPGDASVETRPLAMLGTCFGLLTAGPDPLSLDGTGFAGLPDRDIPLTELRDWLMRLACPAATRDGVWAELIRRSRASGSRWTVGCAGMALPTLVTISRRLAATVGGERADVESEVCTAFLAVIADLDLTRPELPVRMRWAVYRSARAGLALTGTGPAESPDPDLFAARSPAGLGGHPDLVLAGAVADGVLDVSEADLIGATRLDAVTVAAWAAEAGLSAWAAYKRRATAERRLLLHLAGPTSTPARAPSRSVTGRGSAAGAGDAAGVASCG